MACANAQEAEIYRRAPPVAGPFLFDVPSEEAPALPGLLRHRLVRPRELRGRDVVVEIGNIRPLARSRTAARDAVRASEGSPPRDLNVLVRVVRQVVRGRIAARIDID